jgi:hypothetical protein
MRLGSLAFLSAKMSEPVERFCQVVSELPDFGRQEAIEVCCIGLGWRRSELDVPVDGPDPVGELFRAPNIDDLRARLNFVTEQVCLLEAMLIPGLLHYLADFFRRASEPSATSAAIDQDLDQLRQLQEWKAKPLAQRPAQITNNLIEEATARVKSRMTQRTGQRAAAKEMAQRLENDVNKTFPRHYWVDWLQRMLEKS